MNHSNSRFVLFHLAVGTMSFEAIRFMFADALFEVSEIHQCVDCYRHSNEKFDSNWFALPCSGKKHTLVYAKMGGFPYWPGKVIKINGSMYDVRFFGAGHSRSEIDKRLVKPIDCDIRQLNKSQPSMGLKSALKELEEHRRLLVENPSQFSFEAERKARQRQNSNGAAKQKRKSSNGPEAMKRKQLKRRVSKAASGPSGESPNLSTEDIQQLESKQRTRGDIKKIINTIEGTSKVTSEPSSSTLSSVTCASSASGSVASSSGASSSNKKPKIGPKSVMERLSKQEQEADSDGYDTPPAPKQPRVFAPIDLTSSPETPKRRPQDRQLDEPQTPDSSTEIVQRSPRIKAQLTREQNNAVFKVSNELQLHFLFIYLKVSDPLGHK